MKLSHSFYLTLIGFMIALPAFSGEGEDISITLSKNGKVVYEGKVTKKISISINTDVSSQPKNLDTLLTLESKINGKLKNRRVSEDQLRKLTLMEKFDRLMEEEQREINYWREKAN